MTNTLSTLIFFGNERLSSGFSPNGAPTLEALIAAGYPIGAVVANHEQSRSRKARTLEIETIAKEYNIPILLPKKLSDIRNDLIALQPTAGILVAYGKIIPQSIIDIFPQGIINIHPSLLPQYRGSTPIEQAILDGAEKTGVSLMKIVKTMDAGPIYAQKQVELSEDETKQALTDKLLRLGGNELIRKLPVILNGTLQPWDQDESQATFTPQIQKKDGVIDWDKPAIQIEREIRAYAGWPKSSTTLFGKTIILTKARPIQSPTGKGLSIECGHHTYLEILELIAPSGKMMSGEAFLRGYVPNN